MKLSKSPLLSSEPLCLRATGAGITEIDLLGAEESKSLALYVSANKIKTIDNIVQFKHLQTFLAENNLIQYLEDLYPLAELTSLRIIRLEGNPLTETPFWFLFLLYVCPSLTSVNGESASSILGKYSMKEIKKHFSYEKEVLDYMAQLQFLSNLIKSGKYPLKTPYSAEFSKFLPREKLHHFFEEIRRSGPSKSLSAYRKYLEELSQKITNELIDTAEENGIPGDLLQRMSEESKNRKEFLELLKNYLAPNGDKIEQKPKSPVSSIKLGSAAESVLSMMKFTAPLDNDKSSRRSYISHSPSRKSMISSKSAIKEEEKKQTISEDSINKSNDKVPEISSIEVNDQNTKSGISSPDLLENSYDNQNQSYSLQIPETAKKSEVSNSIPNEDAIIVSSLNNSKIMRQMRMDDKLIKMFSLWKSKVKSRNLDATLRIENPNSVSKDFSSIENQPDIADGVGYLMRKHQIMIDIERNAELNEAMQTRKKQLSNEMFVRSPNRF